MSKVQGVLEDQLWLWLEECEARKPDEKLHKMWAPIAPDRVVRVLQDEVREGT